MEGRGWVTLILLAAPLFAGCVIGEPIDVALLVESGTTRVLRGDEHVDGSIVVEPNATLRIEDATLRVEQGILVEGGGALEVSGSRLLFGGPYARQFLAVDGSASLEAATLEGLDEVAVSGALETHGGTVDAQCLRVLAGALDSRGTSWGLLDQPCHPYGVDHDYDHDYDDDDDASARMEVRGGRASFEGGALVVDAPSFPAIRVQGGALVLGNLTLDARGSSGLSARQGSVAAWGVGFQVPGGQRFVEAGDATVRFVDSPHPRNAWPPSLSSGGRFEVAWTLTVRAVALPQDEPVPGVNVTLASADGSTARAATDADGEARFVATQYVYASGAAQSRSGNPHALRASDPGWMGATAGLVFEAPARATLPLLQAASVTNQLSGSHDAAFDSRLPESVASANPAALQSASSSTGP